MATYPTADDCVWSGPAWAAPERAERWLHDMRHPTWRRLLGPVEHVLIRSLAAKQITPEQFQRAWFLKLKGDRETADWTDEDWARVEAANP